MEWEDLVLKIAIFVIFTEASHQIFLIFVCRTPETNKGHHLSIFVMLGKNLDQGLDYAFFSRY